MNSEQIRNDILKKFISEIIKDPNIKNDALTYIGKLFLQEYNSENWEILLSIINKNLLRTGGIEEAKSFLQLLLNESRHRQLKAEIKLVLADIAIRFCNWDECLGLLSEAKLLFKENADAAGVAKVENVMGIYHAERGEINLAKNNFEEGLSILNPEKEPELVAELEANLAISEIICYNFITAEKHLINALKTFKGSDDNRWLAEMIHNYGMLHLYKKNYRQAINDFDGAIDIAYEENHLQILTISNAAKSLALIYTLEIEEGLKLTEEALKTAEEIDDKLTVADNYKIIGVGERARGNYKTAEQEFLKAYNLNVELNNRLNAAECAFELAILYAHLRKRDQSLNWYNNSVKYFESINAENRIKEMNDMMKSLEL